MDARAGVAALLVGVGMFTGCSSQASDHATDGATDDAARAIAAGDPAYALDRLRHNNGEVGGAAPTLEDSLPNHRYALGDTGEVASYSDALALGTVTGVRKGIGVTWRDDDNYTVVDFDDMAADTRTVVVTMTVADGTGAITPGDGPISFRVLVPSLADPDRFAAGMAGLGRIAVVLHRDATDFDSTPWRPLMNDNLIGVIADDGTLTLPGLARGAVFAGDLHTAAQLLAAARAPDTTTTVAVP
jgi:hypothetical protein